MGRVLITAFSVIALAASVGECASRCHWRPGDSIQLVNGVNDGDGNADPPPGAEGVERAVDDFTQKYLNFLDLGSGFIVTPSVGSTTLGGLRFYTANDAIERDPASYLLEGSNNGTDFTLISEGARAADRPQCGRNDAGARDRPIDDVHAGSFVRQRFGLHELSLDIPDAACGCGEQHANRRSRVPQPGSGTVGHRARRTRTRSGRGRSSLPQELAFRFVGARAHHRRDSTEPFEMKQPPQAIGLRGLFSLKRLSRIDN